jgi:hypothetical protein
MRGRVRGTSIHSYSEGKYDFTDQNVTVYCYFLGRKLFQCSQYNNNNNNNIIIIILYFRSKIHRHVCTVQILILT